MRITSISAVTLATHDLARAKAFYASLGFELTWDSATFATFRAGSSWLNLTQAPDDRQWAWWGRIVFHVDDVDAFHARAVAAGLHPHAAPEDAPWHERYFHLTDPDGHELSFATPLR